LGKTTLATIVANEMSVNIKTTSGPAIERAGDLAAILTNLQHGDVLFIDEIHRMQRVVEEVLYPAMEDRQLDIIIGKGPAARSIRLDLQPFTLIGATTRVGLLSAPLRDRFGILERLEFYTHDDLATIIRRAATVLDTEISDDSAHQLARRSRGTPRIANRLLKRVRDWAQVHNNAVISPDLVADACESLAIDALGLDKIDRQYLRIIIEHFNGGPVGIDTIAASLSEDVGTLEDVYEPYLLQIGFIDRTARGRMARPEAYKHLGLTPPEVMVQTKFI
jgi:Holliday junction DNA helicase RuvB